MADSYNSTPEQGDGLTYEHLADRQSLWLDFIADTGDGGHSTYSVAAALAAPHLRVALPPDPSGPQQQGGATARPPLVLPRADLVLVSLLMLSPGGGGHA